MSKRSQDTFFASPAPGRPKAGEIPPGDRPLYSADEGLS
jgi:hypothetical protein